MLFEMPEIDARIFKQELRQPEVLMPFCVQLCTCLLCIYLIMLDTKQEVWLYLRPKHNFFNISVLPIVFSLLYTVLVGYQYLSSEYTEVHSHHFITNFCTMALQIAIIVHAKSRVSDMIE